MDGESATAQNAAGADKAPPPIYRHVSTKKTACSPVSSSRSDIEGEGEATAEEIQQEFALLGAARRAPMSRTRREAFEPLLNWIADHILEQLLAEKRLELEAERKAQANQAAPS